MDWLYGLINCIDWFIYLWIVVITILGMETSPFSFQSFFIISFDIFFKNSRDGVDIFMRKSKFHHFSGIIVGMGIQWINRLFFRCLYIFATIIAILTFKWIIRIGSQIITLWHFLINIFPLEHLFRIHHFIVPWFLE